MKKSTVKTIIWWASLYIIFFIMSCYIVNYEDDYIFQAGIERYGSFWGWVNWFSHNWGGRIVPQGILVLLLQLHPVVFHLIDASAWILLLTYAKKVFTNEDYETSSVIHIILPAMIFLFIPTSVLSGAVFWKCANVLYLWGGATLLVSIYPITEYLKNRRIAKRDFFFASIAIIYTASFEQAGAIMCGFFVVLLLFSVYNKQKMNKAVYALGIYAIIAVAFFYTLPGNAARVKIETLGQLPKYDMYSAVDKILWGLWYTIHNLEADAVFIIVMLSATAVLILRRTERKISPLMLGAWLTLGYFALCMIDQIGISNVGSGSFFTPLFEFVNVDNVSFGVSVSLAMRSIIHFMAYVYLGCIILIRDSHELDYTGFTAYFGGLASMWIMGFSPTIYASGSRPRFLCYFLLICVEIRLLSSAGFLKKSRWVPEADLIEDVSL